MSQAVIAAGYTAEQRNKIFGRNVSELTPAQRNAEQQKYRAAKRATIKANRKGKPKKR